MPIAAARFRQPYGCKGWVVTAICGKSARRYFFGAVGVLPETGADCLTPL